MELQVAILGAKVSDQTKDACAPMHLNLPLGVGQVDVTALSGCPQKAGPINVDINITLKSLPGKSTSTSVTKDQDGNTLLCLIIEVDPAKEVSVNATTK